MGENLSLVIDKYFKKQSRDEAVSVVFTLDGVAVLVYWAVAQNADTISFVKTLAFLVISSPLLHRIFENFFFDTCNFMCV